MPNNTIGTTQPAFICPGARLWQDDALATMQGLASASVDLIATDPPFMNVKMECEWDRQWPNAAAYLDWMGALCAEWRRVLKPNGSLYVFASPQMAARVECKVAESFNVLNRITWRKHDGTANEGGLWSRADKDGLRQFFTQKEEIIFAEQAGASGGGIIADYITAERARAGLTRDAVDVALGYVRTKDPTRGTELCRRWEEGSSIPTVADYERLQALLNANCNGSGPQDLRRDYEELRKDYEELRRPFNVSAAVPFTDVWDFPTVKPGPGKHPCEKPFSLCRHIIEVSSRPGATVLDCFAGSGVMGEAALSLGRQFWGVERDPVWFAAVARRVGRVAGEPCPMPTVATAQDAMKRGLFAEV